MSWFNLDSLNTTLTESLTQVSTSLNQVKTQVQSTLQIDDDLVEALTLRTASLTAERDAIDAEESRKETVKNYLAEMLPWETRDEEREILVEECKEVMLKLSCAEDTFEGPFASSPNNEVNEEEAEGEMEGKLTEVRSSTTTPPHLDKLAKLEPLPPLLEEFDLDTHVGLIQRLLGVDENLSRVHSQLSNAGEKEKIFWKNYFFHCAYVRYENGLSVDEIWASKPSAPSSEELAKAAAAAASQHESIEEEEEEDDNKDEESGEIVFESNSADDGDHPKVESSAGVVGTPATTTPSTGIIITTATTTKNNSSPSSSTTQDNSYEMIANEAAAAAEDDDDDDVIATVGDVSYGGGDDNDDDVVDDGDLDLDDLDAEIARELED